MSNACVCVCVCVCVYVCERERACEWWVHECVYVRLKDRVCVCEAVCPWHKVSHAIPTRTQTLLRLTTHDQHTYFLLSLTHIQTHTHTHTHNHIHELCKSHTCFGLIGLGKNWHVPGRLSCSLFLNNLVQNSEENKFFI